MRVKRDWQRRNGGLRQHQATGTYMTANAARRPRQGHWILIALCAACGLGLAGVPEQYGDQSPQRQKLEIHGVVREVGTSLPVLDADVLLIALPRDRPRILAAGLQREVLARIKTNSNGAFVFEIDKAGDYRLEVNKEGYHPETTSGSTITVTVDEAHARREVAFLLVRPSELSGCVLDDETGKPLPSVRVYLMRRHLQRGLVNVTPAGGFTTDREGCFVARGIEPGDYVARIGSRLASVGETGVKSSPDLDRLSTQVSADKSAVGAWDYDGSWWPGRAPDSSSVMPISIKSGDIVSFGTLSVRKTPVYNVHVVPVSSGCSPSEVISVDVRVVSGLSAMMGSRIGDAPCGKEVLLRGFAQGRYRIELAVLGRSRQSRETGTLSFDVVDGDTRIVVPVARGVDLEGEFLYPEGSNRPPLEKIHIRLSPVGWAGFLGDESNPVDSQGQFRIVNVAIRDQRIHVSNVPHPYYLKEIRYNGRSVPDSVVSLDPSATSHSLRVMLDNKPATVWGAVTDSGKPSAGATVLLVKQPYRTATPNIATTSADEDGKFTFVLVPPGEYRLFAVISQAREMLDKPNVIDRLLIDAEAVSLAERDMRSVNLRVTEIR